MANNILKQLLRKCIARKANERKRKQPKNKRSASPTLEAQRDDGIIVIPQYRRPAEGSDSNPLPPPIVLDATHSDVHVANPISRPSTRTISRDHNKQKAEANNDPPHCEELECIELTDEQPVPASGHFSQDLVFDVPTLKERLAMDKVKRKEEKKEERKKKKEEKKAAKIEKKQRTREEKRVVKCIATKQRGRKQSKKRRSASPTVEAQRDDGITQYRRPAEGSDSNPLPPPIVLESLDATHSNVANPISRPSTRAISRDHNKQKAETSNDPPRSEELNSGEVECIQLTNEQPVPASGHFSQDLFFGVPPLRERLEMDRVKRREEKKAKLKNQEVKKRKEEEATKLEKKENTGEDKQPDDTANVRTYTLFMSKHDIGKIQYYESEITRKETKIERLEEENAERLKEMSCLEQQRIRVTVLDRHKPTTLMKDYELQFARQNVQRDYDRTARDIACYKRSLSSSIVLSWVWVKRNVRRKACSKKDFVPDETMVKICVPADHIVRRIQEYVCTQCLAPSKCDDEPAESYHASDEPKPAAASSSGVIVVKECTSELSSLSSLPKLYPRGFLTTATPCY